MNNFFRFDRLITPTFIKIIFWVGLVLTVLGGLAVLIAANGGVKIIGLIYLVVGPILWRIYCEILIVVFKMNESLIAIRDNTTPRGAAPIAPPSAAAVQ
jgi:hypothetical protein